MTRFKSPRPNLFVSDDGVSVEILGLTGLRYGEGPRQMKVSAEVVTGSSALAIWASSIRRWSPPHESELVSDADRARIIENIRGAIRSQGYEVDVI